MSTKQVNQQKQPADIQIMKGPLNKRACMFKRSMYLAAEEVSAGLANREQIKSQNRFVNSNIKRIYIPHSDSFDSFKKSLTAYLEVVTSKNKSFKNKPAMVVKAKQLIAAAEKLYRSFNGGCNETI